MTDDRAAHVPLVATSSERFVVAESRATCPFSIAEEYAVDYLRRAEAGTAEASIRLPIRFLAAVARRRVTLTFGIYTDVVEAGRPHDEIRLRWSARTRLLPDFRGTLRFRIDGCDTIVRVEGSYRVPLGSFGAAFDSILGRHIARASLSDFTARLADYLEAREHEWRGRTDRPTIGV